jgi:hypothetical protein
MIENAVASHLRSDTDVAAIIRTGAIYRIFAGYIPQQVQNGPAQVPAIVYSVDAVERERLYCGTSRLIQTRIALSMYATKLSVARELASHVRDALIDFHGLMGATPDTADVREVSLENEFSLVDLEPGLHRVEQTYSIRHVEE